MKALVGRWIVQLRGWPDSDAMAAIERAGMSLTGFAHEIGPPGQAHERAQGVWVEAGSAEEAREKLSSAVAGHPLTVGKARNFDDDAAG